MDAKAVMRGRMVVVWGEYWRIDKVGARKLVAVWAGSRQAPPWMRLLWHIGVSLYWPWVLLFHLCGRTSPKGRWEVHGGRK